MKNGWSMVQGLMWKTDAKLCISHTEDLIQGIGYRNTEWAKKGKNRNAGQFGDVQLKEEISTPLAAETKER